MLAKFSLRESPNGATAVVGNTQQDWVSWAAIKCYFGVAMPDF